MDWRVQVRGLERAEQGRGGGVDNEGGDWRKIKEVKPAGALYWSQGHLYLNESQRPVGGAEHLLCTRTLAGSLQLYSRDPQMTLEVGIIILIWPVRGWLREAQYLPKVSRPGCEVPGLESKPVLGQGHWAAQSLVCTWTRLSRGSSSCAGHCGAWLQGGQVQPQRGRWKEKPKGRRAGGPALYGRAPDMGWNDKSPEGKRVGKLGTWLRPLLRGKWTGK